MPEVVLKLVPVIVTRAPTAPLPGVNPVIEGEPNTVKSCVLVTVTPFTVTDMGPVVAPEGTVVVKVFGVATVTVANTPLKRTTLFTAGGLKLVPVMVTVAPTAPLNGLKLVIVGGLATVKLEALQTVKPLTVTHIGPFVAPKGTKTVRLMEVDAVTVAEIPLNVTELFAGVVLKLVPEMVTVAPGAPVVGVNPVMVGVGSMVKFDAVVTVTPLTVIEIGPLVAPAGTNTVSVVEVAPVTVATTPLNRTVLFANVVLKLVPVMVTVAPTAPLVGVKPDMVGVPGTVKIPTLVTVTPLSVTEIGPVEAPGGTVTVSVVADAPVTGALIPLNSTTLLLGVVLKLVPVMVTVAPTAPVVGLKPVIVCKGRTVNIEPLVRVNPLTVIEIGPVIAPAGTKVVKVVVVAAVTVANVPLKRTIFSASVVLKFVPKIVTSAPGAPLVGVNPVKVGVGSTVNVPALVTVTPVPLTRTEMVPVVAPEGTSTVKVVADAPVTVARVPLNRTVLLARVELKLVPVIVTVAPTAALVGVNPVIVGVGRTVKLEALVTVTPLEITEMGPVAAPAGTVTTMLVALDEVTVALTPLKN